MAAWALVGVVSVLLGGQVRLAAGFGVGAMLAILNYLWLHQAIESLLAASRLRVPRTLMAKLAIRNPLALAGVYLFYRTGWLPFGAVLAGLFVPVGGVLTEAVVQIREGLRKA
jgi:hypothetical protein